MFGLIKRVAGVYFILFAQMLDTSVTNLALTKISPDLGIDVLNASWIMTSFGTGLIISFPISGLLSKKYNPDLVFFACSVAFIITSLGCGLGISSFDFILMRFLQGLSSGVVIILSQSIMIRMMGEERKALAMSLWVSAISLAPIFGPLIGAYIAETIGWRWIFFVNVPLVTLCLLALVDDISLRHETNKVGSQVLTTLLFFGVSVCFFQYVLDFGQEKDWFNDPSIALLSVISCLSFLIFLYFNSKKRYMILNIGLFREYNFTFSVIVISLGNGLIFSSLLLLPIWLQLDYGMPILRAGIVVSSGSLIAALLSPIIGNYIRANHYLLWAIMSLLFLALSYVLMSNFQLDTGVGYMLSSRVFFGIGVALFTVPLTALSLSRLNSSQYIEANSINLTLRVLFANFCTSVGFNLYTRQSFFEYEKQVADADRYFIVDRAVGVDFNLATLSEVARTNAFSSIFWVYAALFFLMGLVIYLLNVGSSRRKARS